MLIMIKGILVFRVPQAVLIATTLMFDKELQGHRGFLDFIGVFDYISDLFIFSNNHFGDFLTLVLLLARSGRSRSIPRFVAITAIGDLTPVLGVN